MPHFVRPPGSLAAGCISALCCEQTFHRWKRKFGMMEISQAKRLKELEKENARLKKVVADQILGMEILQEALEKKL
ncbi:MAG: transposase [Verrucomicrobiales bacterium]|nr:transposase [Verrucomicrobiales bacterium]